MASENARLPLLPSPSYHHSWGCARLDMCIWQIAAGERLFASPSPRKRPAPGALPLSTSPLRNASRPTSTFPNLPITEASKPRIGPHNGFNTPGNICLGPAATMATPPKDSSAQPPRVPDGQSSPQASQSPLPNGFNSPAEASAAPQDGSSQDTDAFECTLPQNPGTVTSSAGGSDRISPIFGGPSHSQSSSEEFLQLHCRFTSMFHQQQRVPRVVTLLCCATLCVASSSCQ